MIPAVDMRRRERGGEEARKECVVKAIERRKNRRRTQERDTKRKKTPAHLSELKICLMT